MNDARKTRTFTFLMFCAAGAGGGCQSVAKLQTKQAASALCGAWQRSGGAYLSIRRQLNARDRQDADAVEHQLHGLDQACVAEPLGQLGEFNGLCDG